MKYIVLLALSVLALGCATHKTKPIEFPGVNAIAEGVDLIAGTFTPGSQPDGNTVILTGRNGLIVIDTGRHASHTGKIIELARARQRPVVAIVNTHWHLDHVGGNARLRAEFPGAPVYASHAIEGAMSGFLANYRAQLESLVAQNAADEEAQRPFKSELAIIDSGKALFPDVVITEPERMSVAGRAIEVGLEKHAVTAGDVWLFDRASGVLIAGDLVTLPAPFLDTGCAKRWREVLARIASIEFTTLVPGHGAPMSREQFDAYRNAFNGLLDCASSSAEKTACIDQWVTSTAPLQQHDEKFTRALVDYYIDNHLRGDAARSSKLCGE